MGARHAPLIFLLVFSFASAFFQGYAHIWLHRRSRISSLASHQITLETRDEGGDAVFNCESDQYILDAAEEAGFDIPYSCRAGACSTCVGKLIHGKVDDSEQSYLDDEQLAQNFTLTCVAYPQSDCKIIYDVEDELF